MFDVWNMNESVMWRMNFQLQEQKGITITNLILTLDLSFVRRAECTFVIRVSPNAIPNGDRN